jgi:hypothetical protein
MTKAEIIKIEKRKTIDNIMEIKSWFFGNINEIDKPLTTWTKGKKRKTQITKTRNKSRKILLFIKK